MPSHKNRQGVICRAIKAIRFLDNIRGRCFTAHDLADEIEINHRNARYWVDALSLYYPISIARESSGGLWGQPTLFRVDSTLSTPSKRSIK